MFVKTHQRAYLKSVHFTLHTTLVFKNEGKDMGSKGMLLHMHNTVTILRKFNVNATLPSTMQFTFKYPNIVFYIIFNIQALVSGQPLSVMENILEKKN